MLSLVSVLACLRVLERSTVPLLFFVVAQTNRTQNETETEYVRIYQRDGVKCFHTQNRSGKVFHF